MADEDENDSSGWQLTESDPGVFTELLHTLRVPLIVDDLYSLDPESLASLQPLHALIFLFKYVQPSSGSSPRLAGDPDPSFPGFFAHQVVNNACATLAVLNALGNIPSLPSTSNSLEPTPLQSLLGFTTDLDPQSRGYALTSADWLREAHNALSPPAAVSLDGLGLPKSQAEDAYHFVVYVPVGGVLWELDGLQEFAVSHGAYAETGEGWVGRARDVIEARIATYPPGSLEFSLLALRDDPMPKWQSRLVQLQASNAGAGSEAAELVIKLANETTKRERWAFENSIRRHNHLGLVHALVLALAKAGKLDAARDGARQRGRERAERRRELSKAGVGMDED